jgi:hypothetical protein
MRKWITLLLLMIPGLMPAQNQPGEFMKNLREFCGKQYSGVAVFPEGDKNPFKGEALKIHVAGCDEKEIRIPFRVGENKSRTWVLTLDETGLLLKHDHRHDDGTPDEVTFYGGYANASGNSFQQFFPADEYTAKLIPAAATNEWSLVLNIEKNTLTYLLKRDGQLRFHAEFDLSKPITE